MADAVVFAIAGAKGGVGKTTTSINLSAVLAERGRSVLLVELDLAMANVCDFLALGVDIDAPSTVTLYDVLDGTSSLDDATYEVSEGFAVAPSGTTLDGLARIDLSRVPDVVSEARESYDVVVLDTGAGVGQETVLPLAVADETILVSTPRVAAVRDTKKTRELVERVDGTVAGVVFVKSGSGRSPDVGRIAAFLGVDLLGHVPDDPAVANAQDTGRPVVSAASDCDAARAYGAFGARIHDRIDAVQARRARRERRETVDDDSARRGGDALPAADDGSDGFDFVSVGDGDESADGAKTASQSDRRTPVSPGERSGRTGRSSERSSEGSESADGRPARRAANGVSRSASTDDGEKSAEQGETTPESVDGDASTAKWFIDRARGILDRDD